MLRESRSTAWALAFVVGIAVCPGSARAATPEAPAQPAASDAAGALPPGSPTAGEQGAAAATPAAPSDGGEAAAPSPPLAPNAQVAPGTQAAAPALPTRPGAGDELTNPGYVPGYRRQSSLSLSPYAPRVAALPGGLTPAYGAPSPPSDWTFQFSGFLSASLQFSTNKRVVSADGQSTTVFHAPPQTIDEYASFVGTSTMPGQWAQIAFVYGTPKVSANVSLTTWNPTDPSTFYQIGSQQFISNAFLAFNPFPIGPLNFRASFGYFYESYGNLGQYGPGMYTNSLVAGARGVGEKLSLGYDLSDSVTLAFEDGFMATRNGSGNIDVIQTGQNGSGSTSWPAAWVHHAHLGL